MTDPLPNIRSSIRVEAPRAHVWKILTEPQYVAQWLGCMQYENTVGHKFYMQQEAGKRAAGDVEGATHCAIRTLREPELFAVSWYLPGTPETLVEIRLQEADGDATDVALEHSGWDQFEPEAIRSIREMLENGWSSFVLPGLQRVATCG